MAMVTTPQESNDERDELEAQQEIRLALVMNGGVSLAIWMGGVTVEINRLINRDPVYKDVLDLMSSRVRVDVIAGASAGGINGAMLAAMVSHDNDRDIELTSLRRIWLEDGAMLRLFRSPLQKDPPSLMKGDEFFLVELRRVFDSLTDGPVTDAEDFPVRLTLTTTLLKAASRGFADDFGSLIADADHRGEFNFRRGEELADDFDKVRDPQIANRLALASRCTASFPGAFEPSYVPVDVSEAERGTDPDRPDMKGFVNFRYSRFCVDGGVLVNKPFRPAIRGVFAQPAGEEHIRRVLAYVVPDPGDVEADSPQPRTETQTIGKVIMASAVTVPRAESVSRELEDIADHNRRVQAQRLLREHLLAPDQGEPEDIEALAGRLFVPFQVIRSQRIVDRLTTEADPFERRFDGLGSAPWDTGELRRLITLKPDPWLPAAFPPGLTVARTPWTWGNDTIEAMASIALNLVGAGLRAADAGTELREAIAEARRRLHQLLRTLRLSVLGLEPAFWKRQSELTQTFWAERPESADGDETSRWERESFEEWQARERPDTQQPAGIALAVAQVLVEVAPRLVEVARAVSQGSNASRLLAMVAGLVPSTGGDRAEATLRRLLAQAIVQSVTAAGKPDLDQLVELLQISSTAPNGFDPRLRGKEKVAGRQLGHFGAFYKRSWRANDWMWGRLDGAVRLAQLIVDPARLAQRGLSSAQAFDRIKAIALGPADQDSYGVLSDRSSRGWDEDRARRELAFLDAADVAAPKSLPVCTMAIARRIQLRILQEELPGVADAIEVDAAGGAQEADPATDFVRAVREVQYAEPRDGVRIGPLQASRLLTQCRVGDEKILNEAGSDLFTSTVTTAAAVGVTAFSGSTSGLPAIGRAVVGAVRTPVLALWVMAKNAVSTHRTGFAILMFLLASGAALVAVSTLGNVALPGVFVALGTVILMSGVAMALIRLKAGGVLWVLLALVVTVAFLALPSIIVNHSIDANATGPSSWVRRIVPPAAAVIGLVLGGMVLGLVHARTPRAERNLPGRSSANP